jgi:sugar phosphate isomerase/epimerase
MRIAAPGGTVHLTYCTNIHKGESWAETRAALEAHLPVIKARLSPAAAMGVGLRLSALAARELAEGEELARFRAWLAGAGLYVFTINGFPYGPFHGTRVKQEVYQPDWGRPERVAYTKLLAEHLAALLPEEPGLEGSISTVPLTFRPLAAADLRLLPTMVLNLLQAVADLVEVERRTGRRIALALEPEPHCLLETVEEAVTFLLQRILAPEPVAIFARMAGLPYAGAEAVLRRHLGVCLDVCHAAVEFEDPGAALGRLEAAGIAVPKLQLSAALEVPEVGADTVARLARFEDGVYLHQVVERGPRGRLRRFLDLADAFAEAASAQGRTWRVHCHVPVFVERLDGLGSTQATLAEVLAIQRRRPISRHLEVETYTFDVLPPELRAPGVDEAIARELEWARARLLA